MRNAMLSTISTRLYGRVDCKIALWIIVIPELAL